MPVTHQPKDKLATVIQSLTSARTSLCDLIQTRADEVGRLERFEEQLRPVYEKLDQFGGMATKHDKQACELEVKLSQELSRHRIISEDLKNQIANLRKLVERQSVENEKLEHELKDNVERMSIQRPKFSADNSIAYANTPDIKGSPFVQRLCHDLK